MPPPQQRLYQFEDGVPRLQSVRNCIRTHNSSTTLRLPMACKFACFKVICAPAMQVRPSGEDIYPDDVAFTSIIEPYNRFIESQGQQTVAGCVPGPQAPAAPVDTSQYLNAAPGDLDDTCNAQYGLLQVCPRTSHACPFESCRQCCLLRQAIKWYQVSHSTCRHTTCRVDRHAAIYLQQ